MFVQAPPFPKRMTSSKSSPTGSVVSASRRRHDPPPFSFHYAALAPSNLRCTKPYRVGVEFCYSRVGNLDVSASGRKNVTYFTERFFTGQLWGVVSGYGSGWANENANASGVRPCV